MTSRSPWFAGLALALGFSLAGCASGPYDPSLERRTVPTTPQPRLPPTQVYFYPAAGQSVEQQERDRYECYLWARQQTGFDPSQPQVAPRVRVDVIGTPPPGQDTAAGVVGGALVGAALARPGDAGEGALVGAVAGALLGAASDSARQEQVERTRMQYDRHDAAGLAQLERRASNYRRAMAACLEGRGYTVR